MLRDTASTGLPGIHALHLIDVCQRLGVAERELLAGLGVCRDELGEPDVVIDVPRTEALVERARVLTREPGLGIHLGVQTSVAAYGFVGLAAQSSATLGDALRVAVRYAPARTSAFSLRLEVSARTAALIVDERVHFGSARDVILLGVLIGLWQIGHVWLEREGRESTIDVMFAEPAYYRRFKDLGPRLRFDQPANQLAFDATLLDRPLASADAPSFHLAREQCERLLVDSQGPTRFADLARRLVLRTDGGARSLDELAAMVNVSSRTLRRRLSHEGDSYSTVLESERRIRATDLLCSFELSIKEIAHRLGYSDVANFTRAFRRWTGHTPAAFRRDATALSLRPSGRSG